MKALFNKLFGSRIGMSKLIISVIGFVVGLTLVLVSTEIFFKVDQVLKTNEDSNYLIFNKKVTLLANSALNNEPTFSNEEIEDIDKQPWLKNQAVIKNSNYRIKAEIKKVGMKTDVFFESVPDQFLDKAPYNFRWEEGDELIPIILPRDFLNLYNFGFAIAQGAPQIPASAVGSMTMDIKIIDYKGEKHLYKAKIVNLTDRLPTILVPNSFNEYANKKYGDPDDIVTNSRLIVNVTNPSDVGLKEYVEENGIQTNQDRLNSGKAARIVNITSSILLIFGLCFMGLALINIILTFLLVISEAKSEIKLLLEIGYTTSSIRAYFLKYLLIITSIESLIAFGFFGIINWVINLLLDVSGYEVTATASPATIIIGVALILVNVVLFVRDLNKVMNRYA